MKANEDNVAQDALEQQLAGYIREELLEDELTEPLCHDSSLLADGMIDSLAMVRLIEFIEDTYATQVPPEDFVIEHFNTIDAIAAYLRHRGVTGHG